ncbi:MAG TPA: AAA family ATPase [Actinomycetales bacterium]|nr:AAA family ATPase [Actinomycetales bacterium]
MAGLPVEREPDPASAPVDALPVIPLGPETIARIATTVVSLPPRTGETRVVAVDGPSGSGKTTFARELADELAAPLVQMDHIYPGWDGLEASVPNVVKWLLKPLAEHQQAGYHRYDWVENRYAEWHPVDSGPVIIVEGAGCGATACQPYLSYLVWLEAPLDVRYERAMARDGEGYRPHWDRGAAQEATHFATEGTRERADVRIDTT